MDVHRCNFVDFTPASITCTAFSHQSSENTTENGLRLAVGRADGSIEIWNPHPALKKASLQGTISHDSSRAHWGLETSIVGSEGTSIEGLVWASAKDQAGKPRLFSIGGSTYLTEWDLSTGMPLVNHDCNAGVIWSMAIDQLHERISLGCEDGSVVVVNIQGGSGVIEHETILQRQKNIVLSLCWTEDEIIGGCSDGRIRVWSYNTRKEVEGEEFKGRLIQQLRVDRAKGEPTLIWSLIYSPHTKQFISGDSTGSIKFWNLKHMVLQQSFKVHDADVLCLDLNFNGNKLFSAGVDRKIFEFDYTKMGKQNFKWVNLSNRLLHGNDIRSLSSYQSKDLDLFVSGGVERILHVNSMENFSTSETLTLPMNKFKSNILVNEKMRWVVMWQKNYVKIWKLFDDKSKKLVSKIILQDPEHINDVSVSKNGKYILIGRTSSTKLFELTESESSVQVKRVNSELLEVIGSKIVNFSDETNSLVIYTSENELFKFSFNTHHKSDEFDDAQNPFEFDLPEENEGNDNEIHSYMTTYTNSAINKDGSLIAFSKPNGVIDTFNLKTTSSNHLKLVKRLIKFSKNSPPTTMEFSSLTTLMVTTLDHIVHEFNVTLTSTLAEVENSELYTEWSKLNSTRIPQAFTSLKGTAKGMFENLGRYWIWGENWVSFFDSHEQLPDNLRGEKRNRNGTVANGNEQNAKPDVGFWVTKNYTDLLFVGKLNESEFVVVERHLQDLPIPPAFKLNKYSL